MNKYMWVLTYYWIHLLQPLYTFQNFLLKNNPLF